MIGKNARWIFILLLLVLSACTGSGQQKEAATTKPPSDDPVTLILYNQVGFKPEYIDDLIVKPLQEKYPSITIKPISFSKTDPTTTLDQIIVSGNIPDIIIGSSGNLQAIKDAGLSMDLTSLIKSYQFSLDQFQDGIIDAAKIYSGKGEILFLPWFNNRGMLYYNKDIFDKFGVTYPKDGLTWKDTADLTLKLTRTDGNQQYLGFDMNSTFILGTNSLSLPFIDPHTEKASVNNDEWQHLFQTFKNIYDIPGMRPVKSVSSKPSWDSGTVAMLAYQNNLGGLKQKYDTGKPMNWDMVTLPEFLGKSHVGSQLSGSSLYIAATSKYKDRAFQVVDYLYSDEVLTGFAHSQSIPVVKIDKFTKEFGKGEPAFAGKNISSVFKQTIAPTPTPTPFDSVVKTELIKQFNDAVIAGSKDINSALREAEENINKQIQEEKAK